MMCCLLWPEFRGWCRSFTRTEALLALLQGVLLVICIISILFLVLHLQVCGQHSQGTDKKIINNTTPKSEDDKYDDKTTAATTIHTHHTTLNDSVECTWHPSEKTVASTRYYEADERMTTPSGYWTAHEPVVLIHDIDDLEKLDPADGVEDDSYKDMVLALVKMNPKRGYTFGCILTAISQYWTLTAASCVEAVEETDSVEVFVMLERWGGRGAGGGARHVVADVLVWPRGESRGQSQPERDLAALRSATPLHALPALLPTLLDYYTLTLGERLQLLGFGGYRSDSGGGVRAAGVVLLPLGSCQAASTTTPMAAKGGGEAGWAGRHLARGGAVSGGRCSGWGPLCAGRRARGGTCRYCAGAPLLRGRTLLALMAEAPHCGISCDPTLFVNIAAAKSWITRLDNDDDDIN